MHWFTPLRPPFLVLTPACMAVGIAAAFSSRESMVPIDIVLCLVGALCAHASVNAFNEHTDFVNGLDLVTRRTPFSGGSGALPARPELATTTLVLAWIGVAITASVGIWFAIRQGLAVLPVGGAGLMIVLTYSRFIVRSTTACLLAPGLGFGPLMILGTTAALTGRHDPSAAMASLPVFFVVNNLLLLNQFPDREADRQVGRRNAVIALGYRGAAVVYIGFALSAAVSLTSIVVTGNLPSGCLVSLFALLPCIPAARAAWRYDGQPGTLDSALGLNVASTILMPAIIAAEIALG